MEKIVDYLHGDWSDIHSNWKQHALTQICANMAKLNEIIEHLALLDKLAKRVTKLEFYYKTHRKGYLKK